MGEFPNKATQFKKGQSGNPKGKPAWKPVEQLFRDFLDDTHEHKGVTRKRIEWLTERVFADAMAGKPQAQQLLYDRTFGKAKQTIAHEGGITLADNRAGVVERFLERVKK